jgi:hypothetical protein
MGGVDGYPGSLAPHLEWNSVDTNLCWVLENPSWTEPSGHSDILVAICFPQCTSDLYKGILINHVSLNALRMSQCMPCMQGPVAHACHPSYSGGRHQEDPSSKPA